MSVLFALGLPLVLSYLRLTGFCLAPTGSLSDVDRSLIPSIAGRWRMMKTLGVISVLLPTLILANPSAGEAQAPPVLQPSELCSDHPDRVIATFEDANLGARVRAALSVGAQQDLTCGLVSGLTGLLAPSANIVSLVGIQNLTSLTHLDLEDNSITDISALSGLTSLTELLLWHNSITDISALSGLTSLTDLDLPYNSISDISALSGLTSLTDLNLDINSITDIGPLIGLTSLAILYVSANPITDIGPLSGLTNLYILRLDGLPGLTDIQPLLNNTGFGTDDIVVLRNTNVSCTDVALLEAKGVIVASDCP